MRNIKKYFSFSSKLNVESIKCLAKNHISVGLDHFHNNLNVVLATKDSVYSYNFVNDDLQLLFCVSEHVDISGEVHITTVIHDDITEALIVCLKSGEIVSFQIDNGIVTGANVLANITDGIECAEWSPDGEIVAVCNSETVYLLSATYFDIINEINLATSALGDNQQVNVGWGKKETQFHGSEGKGAAKKTKVAIDKNLIKDDHTIHVSWRGDSQLFSVSYWDSASDLRFIKTFDKCATLLSINEELTGITGPISWRPYGDLLAFSERTPDHYAIGFLEKNGLKHGEFNIPPCFKVKRVQWNSDSSILALVCQDNIFGSECLLLWTTCNYHWYLKQKLVFSSPLVCLLWDDARGNRLYGICEDRTVFASEWVSVVDFNREWCPGGDDGYVAVIDNDEILLTSFKESIIPPPMSRWSLNCSESVNSVIFPSWSMRDGHYDGNLLCTILFNNVFILWKRDGPSFVISEKLNLPFDNTQETGLNASLNHWIWFEPESFACIRQPFGGSNSVMDIFKKEENDYVVHSKNLDFCAISLHFCDEEFLIQSSHGALYKFNKDSFDPSQYISLPEPCHRLEFSSKGIYSLSEKHRLYKEAQQIGSQVTSFLLHGSFLLATTSLHTLLVFKNSAEKCTQMSMRKLENGSRLVVATGTTVIFQLPRGNLEAIQPRALTVEMAGKLFENNKFKEAISLLCKQRIDLNLAVDHNASHFLSNVDEFVQQVEPKWLTLLVTELKSESVTSTLYSDFYGKDHSVLPVENKVVKVCQALYSSMTVNQDKYILPILGTLVKTESMAEALKLAISEDSLEHLLFLVDSDKLYNDALLAYNLDAALRIAGKSLKDPKEYLPYLNSLHSMEPNYMKYTIDKTLGKPESALKNIVLCEGEEKFNECLQLIKTHSLYSAALKLFPPHSEKYNVIAELYGDHLSRLKKYDEAGIMFKRSGAFRKAVEPFMKIGDWRQCIALANQCGYSDKEKESLIQTLKGVLKGMQKFQDAGVLCLEILHDVQGCVDMLLQGKLWKEAYNIATFHYQPLFIENDIKKSLLDHADTILNDIKTSTENFSKHFSRLKIVREDKNKPATPSLAEPWENQSDTSSVSSLRTGHSSASRSSKNTRKTIRKMWSLKEGNPREEQALISALATLIESIEKMSGEIKSTCLALLQLECDDVAIGLQAKYKSLLDVSLKSRISIWPRDPDLDEISLMDEKLKLPPQSCLHQDWEVDFAKS